MHYYRPTAERVKDFLPVELPLPEEILNRELKRCQDCGVPFCHATGCPLTNVIPEINSEALAGRWDSALANLLGTSPFPEFTSRICPALCEGSCVQGLNDQPVPCRRVEYEVIERGFASGLMSPRPPLERRGPKVGVIGSGPAGLAAAHRLNQAGAQVTVYERDAKPGGFLRYGIPDFKLEKRVLDRRLTIMELEGVDFECQVEAGSDLSCRLLQRRHDYLVLAGGARKERDLAIPGRQLQGVHQATAYLSAQNRVNGGELAALPPEFNARGRKVLVIGGGDTGSDCVGTAWRQGAREVTQFEIMPQPPLSRGEFNPWPQWPRVLKTTSSHEEGGQRRWNIDTLEFLPAAGEAETVGAVRCREVRWLEENGRLIKPEPRPGTEFQLEADLVLLALGFTGTENGPLLKALNLSPDNSGRLARDQAGQMAPGIFACGDAANGPSLVVRAIADGLKVAEGLLKQS